MQNKIDFFENNIHLSRNEYVQLAHTEFARKEDVMDVCKWYDKARANMKMAWN